MEDTNTCERNLCEKESRLEMCCDITLLSRYKKGSLSQFWISLENEYQSLSPKAIKLLVIFLTTYLREKTFSALVLIKTRQINLLDPDAKLRLSETSLRSCLSCTLAMREQKISQ